MEKKMRLLVCGNGNMTKKQGRFYSHNEVCKFLQECLDNSMETTYATIILDEKDEKVKNLSNAVIPDSIRLELFPSFSRASALSKLILMPIVAYRILSILFRYDFLYCFYPGTVASLFVRAARVFHKKYGLYVRGEIRNDPTTCKDIRKASFVFATGTSIVERLCPEYPNCHEVAPMSNVFHEDRVSEPRTAFHQPLRGLFVGRVSKEKGCYELLEAMKTLKERSVPTTMTLVGAYNDDFLQAVRSAKMEDRVILAGLTYDNAELRRYYQEADFFCLPTWTEGFPRVLYEAMSHALPCITTLVGGIPSRMNDGENCIAIEVRNPDSIVSAISTLAENPDRMVSLSKASHDTFQHWKEYFSDQIHAKQLHAELTSLFPGSNEL